jgi:hypothetical protein
MNSLEEKKIDIEHFVEKLKEDSSNKIVFIVGAGISVDPPTCCPSWDYYYFNRVVNASMKFYPDIGKFNEYIQHRLKKEQPKKDNQKPRKNLKPELFCQIMYDNLQKDFWGFLDIMLKGKPNFYHSSIAYMMSKKYNDYNVPFVLTTNFDTYIEDSLKKLDVKYKPYINRVPNIKTKGSELKELFKQFKQCKQLELFDIFKRITSTTHQFDPTKDRAVIHLHGSLDRRSSIVLTLRRAGLKLNKKIAKFIEHIFYSYTVIIVGYSGNDYDIMPVFLKNAKSVKKVFWVLYDDKSLKDYYRLDFAYKCDNSFPVKADKRNIFKYILNEYNDNISDSERERIKTLIERTQDEFLDKWASNIKKEAWLNFYSELILKIDPTDEEAKFVAEQADIIIHSCNDSWLVTKALVNHGNALLIQANKHQEATKNTKLETAVNNLLLKNKYQKGVDSLLKAGRNYKLWGRHREYIESMTMMLSKIPCKWDFGDDDPLFYINWLSGKLYDPYLLSLTYYALGISLFNDEKIEHAEESLKIAAGFAIKCGDSMNLINCLEALSKIFHKMKNEELKKQCLAESEKIKKALGIIESTTNYKESKSILDKCKEAADKQTCRLLKGEIKLFFIYNSIFAIIIWIIEPTFWIKILSISLVSLAWIAVKLWHIIKKYLFPDIART